MILILLLWALHAPKATAMDNVVVLKARYQLVPGTDPGYAQGAIERNDLRHRPLPGLVWLILVEGPADLATWQSKLNAAGDPKHGTFLVECPTAEEESAVRSGTIDFQQ